VSPQVDGGKYPAKAVLQKEFIIAADVFTDGHDDVNASVLLKYRKDRTWKEFPMRFLNNDHWELDFYPDKPGFYQFQIQGWVDHFSTWHKGIVKKYEAGQNIKTELQAGALLIEETAKRATAKEKNQLLQFARAMVDAGTCEDALLIAA